MMTTLIALGVAALVGTAAPAPAAPAEETLDGLKAAVTARIDMRLATLAKDSVTVANATVLTDAHRSALSTVLSESTDGLTGLKATVAAEASLAELRADAASMVTNWGSRGVEQINTDITLTLARLPVSLEIGLSTTDRVSADGIAVGTAVVFNREGKLGTAVVSSLANAKRAVDFEKDHFADDPRSSNA